MNNGISFAIGSVIGATLGCIGTYAFFKKREDVAKEIKNDETEKYINEEIKKALSRKEEKFKNEVEELQKIIETQQQKFLEHSAMEASNILPNNDDDEEHVEYHNIFEDSELQKNDVMKKYMSRGNTIEKAIIIDENTFIDKQMELDPKTDLEVFEVVDLIYYKGDDIVAEGEQGEDTIISPDIYGISKSMISNTTEQALYFALIKTKILIRIVVVDESYEETHYDS